MRKYVNMFAQHTICFFKCFLQLFEIIKLMIKEPLGDVLPVRYNTKIPNRAHTYIYLVILLDK